MATNTLPASVSPFAQMPAATKIKAGAGVIALGAVAVSAWLWSQQPDWKVLYNNLPDREGGTVIAQLVQMNVPYKYTEGGGAIMVPANMVNDARLRLAAQGLPASDTTGYELLEKQRFGTTQFQERLNFQRGLEGELARSIQSLAAVKQARVHLAMPVQSGFLREQQKPSASVMLTLYPGRTLERGQVQGILALVASSVPDMSPKQVSVVDQYGKLLSDLDGDGSEMNTAQINYRNRIESTLARRIDDLLAPIVGDGNIRAQVAADIDFTQRWPAVTARAQAMPLAAFRAPCPTSRLPPCRPPSTGQHKLREQPAAHRLPMAAPAFPPGRNRSPTTRWTAR